MQITKLVKNQPFNSLVAVLLIAIIGVFINKPDSDLEQRVSDLENRVTLIEEALLGTDTIATTDKGWQDVENWRKLRVRMSEKQVQELLGPPVRIDGGGMATWDYSRGGRVRFMDGRVHSWTEPR